MIAGPSGSGKTTLAVALVAVVPGLRRAITATTRFPREGERDGVDYLFLSPEAFGHLALAGGLLEETSYRGNRYGLPRAQVDPAGETLVVVDPPGIANLRAAFGGRVCAIGLSGLGAADLAIRLQQRGAAEGEVAARLADLAGEVAALQAACDFLLPPGSPDEVLAGALACMENWRERKVHSRQD